MHLFLPSSHKTQKTKARTQVREKRAINKIYTFAYSIKVGDALPISDTRKWKVNKSANEILKMVKTELLRKNAKLIEANSERIEATLGSEGRTRLFGGLLVSMETLPVKITLRMNESASETEIDAIIQDNFGPGFRIGMVGKYKEYMQNLLNLLATVLEAKG